MLTSQQTQCSIFSTTFNPEGQRLGNKILRQRLKGPILAAYYPRKSVTISDLQKDLQRYDLETIDEDEEDRLEDIQVAKLRGKGAPKKKRTAEGMQRVVPGYSLSTNRAYSQQEEEEEVVDYLITQICTTLIPTFWSNTHKQSRDLVTT